MIPLTPRRYAASLRGFTLLEAMTVAAIVAILAAIALPSYRDYVRRGKIQEGTTALSDVRVKMEQYYQDKRKYTDGPCLDSKQYEQYTQSFSYGCVVADDDHFKITASGKDSLTGFAYTINESGIRTSVAWGATGATCWILRKGDTCS